MRKRNGVLPRVLKHLGIVPRPESTPGAVPGPDHQGAGPGPGPNILLPLALNQQCWGGVGRGGLPSLAPNQTLGVVSLVLPHQDAVTGLTRPVLFLVLS